MLTNTKGNESRKNHNRTSNISVTLRGCIRIHGSTPLTTVHRRLIVEVAIPYIYSILSYFKLCKYGYIITLLLTKSSKEINK